MTEEELAQQSEAIASEYELELERVRSVLAALDDHDKCFWVLHGPGEELRNAIGHAGPTQAIETFEGADLEVLGVYVIWTAYLTSRLTPLYTLGELADLIEAFIPYLKRNRGQLLGTGHLQTRFDRSPWLEWHLGRLYYVKRPIVSELERPSPAKPQRDEFGDLFYEYLWTREQPRRPFAGGQFQDAFDFDGLSIVAPEGAPVTFCDYDQAPMMPGLTAQDDVELARLRPKLLELRLHILRRLASALRRKEAAGLWEDCLKVLTQTSRHGLTADEAELLGEKDLHYGVTDETIPSPDYAPHPLEHSGGLNSLLTVIWHVEKEIDIGTMRTVRDLTKPWLGTMQLQSYYQAIGEAWRADLEEAVRTLFRKSIEEDGFWERHRQRLEKALEIEFPRTVTVTHAVPAAHREAAQAQLEAMAKLQQAEIKRSGELPSLSHVYATVGQPAASPTSASRVQDVAPFLAPEGTTWNQVEIVFFNEETVRITIGDTREHKTFTDMGFVNRRRKNFPQPDKLWTFLRLLAALNGKLDWARQVHALAGGQRDKVARQISDLRHRIKAYFPNIQGNPIWDYREVKAYLTKFGLSCSDSYQSEVMEEFGLS